VLEIISDGVNPAQVTIVYYSYTYFTSIHTKSVHFILLDTATYDDVNTMLLKFDVDSVTNSAWLRNAGLAYANTSQSYAPSISISVQNAAGEESRLTNAPVIGTTFTLVNKIDNKIVQGNLNDPQTINIVAGSYWDYVLKAWIDNSDPDRASWKGTWMPNDTSKAEPILEGMLANAIALQNAADLLTETGISNALMIDDPRYVQRGIGLFTAFRGYSQKHDTNSHVNFRGFSFVGGPAFNYDTPAGHLLLGVYLEGGKGHWDSSNKYKIYDEISKPIGRYYILASGTTDYVGGGLLVRHDFNQGYYAETSIRGGRITNDFYSSDMGRGQWPAVIFTTTANYLGVHGGFGYRYEYKPGLMLDAYAKIYWTSIGGDSLITQDGMPLEFHKTDFFRTRLGVRYSTSLTEFLTLNFGGAWDHSYAGANYGLYQGTVSSDHFPITPGHEPALAGSSGILEFGLDFKPYQDAGFSLNLDGKAYLGRVSGFSGGLNLKYIFGGPLSSQPYQRSGHLPSFGESTGATTILAENSSNNDFEPSWQSGVSLDNQNLGGQIMIAQNGTVENENSEKEDSNDVLSTVTVYSEPRWKQLLSPGSVSVVVPDDYSGEQKSLGDFLDIVPGVHVRKRGGSGQYTTVNVRGSTSNQTVIYVDGVPQNLGGDAAADISLYSSENVARIEVYKGYIPVRFVGAPIGGVINIVTKKPQGQQTTISSGIRSWNGFKANGLFTSPLFYGSLLISATRDQSDGDFKYKFFHGENNPNSIYATGYRRRKNNSHQKTDVMVKWQTEHIMIQAAWKEMDRFYPAPTKKDNSTIGNPWEVDLNDGPWGINRRHNQRLIEKDLTIGYRNDWKNLNWGVQLNFKRQDQNYKWIDGPAAGHQGYVPSSGSKWSKYITDRWGINFDAAYKLAEHNLLEFKGSLIKEKLFMKGNDWQAPHNQFYVVGLKNKYNQDVINLQLQDTISLSGSLWLTLIARLDQVKGGGTDESSLADGYVYTASNGGKSHFTWGGALKHNINENFTFKATFGTFIRYPNYYELFGDGVYIKPALMYAKELPLPRPEKGEQWDVTLEWHGVLPWFDIQGNFAATYFSRRTEDMIGLFRTAYYIYYGNYGKTTAKGLEFEADLKSTYVDINFSLTWLETDIIDLAKNSGNAYTSWFSEGHEILYNPKWETNLRADFHVPGLPLTIFAEHHYTSKVPISQGISVTEYEQPLELVNAGFKVEIIHGMKLIAGVNDVFNASINQGYYDDRVTSGTSKPETLNFPREGQIFYTTVEYNF
jgi:outer membrane receptor protein involved in Fe transport